MNIEDIITGIIAGRMKQHCGCAVCAIVERAENNDSKEESDLLLKKADMVSTLRANIGNFAKSLPDRANSERQFRETAEELDKMGFPETARLIRVYIDMVDQAANIWEKCHEEAEENEKRMDANPAAAK